MKLNMLLSALLILTVSCASKPQFDPKTETDIRSSIARDDILGRLHMLFRGVDSQNWKDVKEVLADEVEIDMGQGYSKMTSDEVIKMWQTATKGQDALHHLVSNYGIVVRGTEAKATFEGHAIHYKKLKRGQATKHFYGSYAAELNLPKPGSWEWKVTKFQYKNKFNE